MVSAYTLPIVAVNHLAQSELSASSLLKGNEFLQGFVKGFLPLVILAVFLAVLPYILLSVARFQGSARWKHEVHLNMFGFYFVFLIVNVLLEMVFFKGFWEQVDLFLSTPSKIPMELGRGLGGCSTIFLNLLCTKCYENILLLLRLPRLVKFRIKARIAKKEKRIMNESLSSAGAEPSTESITEVEVAENLPVGMASLSCKRAHTHARRRACTKARTHACMMHAHTRARMHPCTHACTHARARTQMHAWIR